MQLYKTRDFSAFFQDTFAFIKQNGGHFFKHFFIVNGLFVLLLMVLGYFFVTFYTEMVFGGLTQNDPNVMDDFINENSVLFLFVMILFLVASILFGIFMYAFPVFYLKLYRIKGGKNFGTAELITEYKENLSRLFIYVVCAILLGIPLIMVFAVIVFVLFITIIGLLVIPFVMAILMLFYYLALSEYLEGKMGIWDAFGYAWKLLSSKFFPAVACAGLFYLMSYIIQNVITVIAYIFGLVQLFTDSSGGNPDPEAVGGMMTVVMVISFIGGFLLGIFLNNIVLLNQGIIYHSLKEEVENIHTKDVIDQIGSGE
ncbi:MAG: hypothetical protein KJO49_04605 [Bacteroidia bacterium]|nr:hypothetical protein [Bacteroidia bacterium]MBT8268185.1 hypothetical protein [Bacteroidia bacterium]NNK69218.1 hypothetical protein [Flavobacteriaceae bacterium]NNL81182.1 hypothetical protein [Flavobacteriaceae bacterium]